MRIARIWTAQDLKNEFPLGGDLCGASFKFVRVAGEYRFHRIGANCANHSDMVDSDEQPDVAGTVFISSDGWELASNYSQSLDIRCEPEQVADLTEKLGRPCVYSV